MRTLLQEISGLLRRSLTKKTDNRKDIIKQDAPPSPILRNQPLSNDKKSLVRVLSQEPVRVGSFSPPATPDELIPHNNSHGTFANPTPTRTLVDKGEEAVMGSCLQKFWHSPPNAVDGGGVGAIGACQVDGSSHAARASNCGGPTKYILLSGATNTQKSPIKDDDAVCCGSPQSDSLNITNSPAVNSTIGSCPQSMTFNLQDPERGHPSCKSANNLARFSINSLTNWVKRKRKFPEIHNSTPFKFNLKDSSHPFLRRRHSTMSHRKRSTGFRKQNDNAFFRLSWRGASTCSSKTIASSSSGIYRGRKRIFLSPSLPNSRKGSWRRRSDLSTNSDSSDLIDIVATSDSFIRSHSNSYLLSKLRMSLKRRSSLDNYCEASIPLRKRNKTTFDSRRYLALPDTCPYFTGGRLDPNSDASEVSIVGLVWKQASTLFL